MNITNIRCNHSRYASTNPPTNTSEEYDLRTKPDGSRELAVNKYRNGLSENRIYTVTQEQYGKIASMFEELNIIDYIKSEFNSQPAPQMPPVAGGFENEGISFAANGITIIINSLPTAARELVAAIRQLEKECGNPVFENTFGQDTTSPSYSPVEAAMSISAGLEKMKNHIAGKTDDIPGTDADGWVCSDCGNKNNANHKFCTECGKVK